MKINLDANACYGLLPEVRSAISGFNDYFNPSSIHQNGQKARALIEDSRSIISEFIGLSDEQRIVFTSGASESNTQALLYPFWSDLNKSEGKNIIVSTIEHPSVLETARKLSRHGIELRLFNPFSADIFSELTQLMDQNTKLVSIMTANNETGLILPVEQLFAAVKKFSKEIITHTDAVQAAGKIDFKAVELNADFISLSAHKLGGLTGSGALIVSKDTENQALIFGGPQESRWRAGTENVSGIYSFGIAAAIWQKNAVEWRARMSEVKTELADFIATVCPSVIINIPEKSLPNTINIEIPGRIADDLVVAFDLAGIAVSSGSACASGKPLPSHVLLAMGKTAEQARAALRLSFRADLTIAEVELIKKVIRQLLAGV